MGFFWFKNSERACLTPPVVLALLRAGFKPAFPAWEADTLTRPQPLVLIASVPL